MRVSLKRKYDKLGKYHGIVAVLNDDSYIPLFMLLLVTVVLFAVEDNSR